MISPYTRGGHVFTERGDHSSILLFLEQWLAARGYKGLTTEDTMSDWRRAHESDLVNAFDFENPDFSLPDLPIPQTPIQDANGDMLGLYAGFCSEVYGTSCSSDEYYLPYPYGKQTEEDALYYEDGFKGVRGYLTEGRYLTFEANGYALYTDGKSKEFSATPATAAHDDIHQRWVLHALEPEGNSFYITSAVNNYYISQHSSLSISESGAETYNITYMGSSKYQLQKENGDYLNIDRNGELSFVSTPIGYNVYSVTYHS
ncbi:hypothetical protein SCUCBS95973_003069 [Sporothrix curviconia]|uniref:Uncharacterized protein n=1 Tax=Sporothrix curviconia TaxID=1260050 RepID=A0ABP0BC60_9PEZI